VCVVDEHPPTLAGEWYLRATDRLGNALYERREPLPGGGRGGHTLRAYRLRAPDGTLRAWTRARGRWGRVLPRAAPGGRWRWRKGGCGEDDDA
jgi:hypothetical protein